MWSKGSKTTAIARIWGLPSPFVKLGVCKPSYVIELVAEKFTRLSCDDMVETIIHELLHIPRSFSGGLRAHGEWSRRKNLEKITRSLSSSTRDYLCKLIRESLEKLE